MSDLYALIVAKFDEYDTDPPRCAGDPPWFCGAEDYLASVRALRAVVQRHAPESCLFPTCKSPGQHFTCKACGRAVNHPCEELRVIAEQLGIPTEGVA